jgi:hypothetical protein
MDTRVDGSVATVMEYVAVRVPPDGDTATTLHAFTQAAWDWLRSRRG